MAKGQRKRHSDEVPSEQAKPRRESKRARKPKKEEEEAEECEEVEEQVEALEDEDSGNDAGGNTMLADTGARRVAHPVTADEDDDVPELLDPFSGTEAIHKWPERYRYKENSRKGSASKPPSECEGINQAKGHYKRAKVDGTIYEVGEDAYVKAEDGNPNYIARILEIFEGTDGEDYFRAQWFYRAEDTPIKDSFQPEEKRRVFISQVKDDNPLNCIVSKVKIACVVPNLDLVEKEKRIPDCDLYYDMQFTIPFLTFATVKKENPDSDSCSSTISDSGSNNGLEVISRSGVSNGVDSNGKTEMHLLDLYSGCGAMSTGLCMGAALSNVKLITRWAVDMNPYACESLRKNHPETEVRVMPAEDFLFLLKEWEGLCRRFSLIGPANHTNHIAEEEKEEDEEDEDNADGEDDNDEESFEVERVLEMCYGDPNNIKKCGLYFKVRWKGYDSSEDTWEPLEGMSGCQERLKEYVVKGFKSNILPLPGTVDFICGGPPCQGISGFNRFRNSQAPLDDPKNHQLVVFMNIVEFLKPKYVLMENVVDLLKFAKGYLGRYALGRLVSMNYQARFGMMVAGSYGLPQFRNRVFLWGAHPLKCLPQYPLPTHEVVNRGGTPNEFEEISVCYDKDQHFDKLEKALYLGDAIKDLPRVGNDESRNEMQYGTVAKSEFQKYIRQERSEMVGFTSVNGGSSPHFLFDHRSLQLNEDDYQRVCRIPKKKGANFRDLPGVLVDSDNKVYWDPSVERELLPSGKQLVPDYAMSFVRGKSTKPFGRLWWDETVATVVTRAEPHNQIIIHPEQDRVLTIRENARLQGFPDCYRLYGPIKQRYMQVGNAVAIPVALALGYSFGQASQGSSDENPLITLPFKFPSCLSQSTSEGSG